VIPLRVRNRLHRPKQAPIDAPTERRDGGRGPRSLDERSRRGSRKATETGHSRGSLSTPDQTRSRRCRRHKHKPAGGLTGRVDGGRAKIQEGPEPTLVVVPPRGLRNLAVPHRSTGPGQNSPNEAFRPCRRERLYGRFIRAHRNRYRSLIGIALIPSRPDVRGSFEPQRRRK
jgi:hypothetical protein